MDDQNRDQGQLIDELDRLRRRVAELEAVVAERVKIDEVLRRSEERFRALVESSSDVTVVLGSNGNLIYISPNFEKVWGFKAEGALGQDMFKNIHPDDIPEIGKNFADIIKNPKAPMRMQIRALYPDGTWHTLDVEARNHLADPAIGGIVANFHDVTELKRAEELIKLQRDLAQKLSAASNLEDGLKFCLDTAISVSGMDSGAVYSLDGNTGALSLKCHKGLSQPFIETASFYGSDHPSTRLIMQGRPAYAVYQELRLPMDEIRRQEGIKAIAIVPFSHEGRVIGCINIASHTLNEVPLYARDALEMISTQIGGAIARMQTRQKLRESEEKYSTLVENATDGVSIIQDKVIKFANKRMAEMSGYTNEELTGMSAFDLVPPDFTPVLADRFTLRDQGKDAPEIFRSQMLCKDGTVKEMESSTKLIQYEGKPAAIGIIRDITERKRMEDALKKSEEKFAKAFKVSPDSISITSVDDGRYIDVNDIFLNTTGFSRDEVIGHTSTELRFWVRQSDRDKFVQKLGADSYVRDFEVKYRMRSGDMRDFLVSAETIHLDGKAYVISFIKDITERKRMEDALRESEEKNKALIENIHDAIFIIKDAKIKYANEGFAKITGYSVDELIGKGIDKLVAPEDLAMVADRYVRRMKGAQVPSEYEFKLVKKDGVTRVDVIMDVGVITYEGGPAAMGIGKDITERKRMEEALRVSEEKYRLLADNASDVIMLMDMNAKPLYFSPSVTRLLGYSLEEALTGSMEGRMTPASIEKAAKHFMVGLDRERREPGGSAGQTLELEMIHKNGSIVIVEMTVSFIRDESGKPTGMMAILRDITDRKKTEARIIELSNAFMATLDPVLILDMEGNVRNVNESARKLFETDEIGVSALEPVAPEDREVVAAALQELITSGQPAVARYNIVTRSGRRVPLESSGSLILDANGKPVGIVVVARDLIERRQAEAHQKLAAEILGILNEPMPLPDAISRILTAIKRETGFYAVGIRLKKDEDFPYFVQNGFSEDFLLTENTLVARDQHGDVCRDKAGNVNLECTCGLVLSGKTDPSNPLFTPGGSAWTNDSIPLLDIPLDQDPRHHPRNRCIHAGFQSVALMPIRSGKEIVGLLQLNDRRKGCFTPEMIRFFEGIAASIGVALMRKQAEDALRESELKYRSLVEQSLLGVLIIQDGRVVYMNHMMEEKGGYSFSELESMPPSRLKEIIHPDDRDVVWNRMLNRLSGKEEPERNECRFTSKDGSVYWADVHTNVVEYLGRPAVQMFVVDITEGKKAEDALIVSEVRYRRLFESAKDGILILDADTGMVVDVNPFLIEMLGYSHEQFMGKRVWELGPLQDIIPNRDNFLELQQQQYIRYEDMPLETEDGRRVDVEFVSNVYPVDHKKVIQCNIRDITGRKKAQEALRESEEKFRTLAEQSPNMIFINVRGRIVYANRSCEEIMGYTSEEFYSSDFDFRSLTAPEYQGTIEEKFQAHMRGQDVAPYDYVVITKDGRRVDTILSTKLVNYGGEKAILGTITDITERRRMEAALWESEAKYRDLFEHTLLGMEVVDAETGKIVLANHSMARMFGFKSPEDMVGIDAIRDHILPEDMDWVLEQLAQSLADTERSEVATLRAKTTDGRIIWVSGSTTAFTYQGKMAALISLIDVTEVKEAEETLLRINKAVESSSDAIGMSDAQGHHFYHNKAFTEMFEYAPEELEAAGGGPAAFANKHIARKVFDTIMGGGSWIGEVEMVSKSGRRFIVLERADAIKDESGKVIGLVGVHTDITERKKAEEKLRETRDYMENLIEHANVPMVVWTPDFRITRFNRAFERLTGMKAKAVIGKDLEILFPKGTRERSMSYIRTAMRGARWEVVEIPIANLDGDVRTVLWNISPIYAEDGKTPMAIIAQGQDITERKKAEEALRESEELSRSMLESAAMGIYLLQNKRFIYVNPMFEEIIGYSSEELMGQEAIDFVHPDDRDIVRTKAVENIQGASAQPYEFRALRKDGRQIWVMERVTPVRYKGRRAVLASFMETTEHKKAEVELERAYEDLKTMHENMVQSQKLRAMGEMASGIAHDFNNMLAVILGRTQLVIDDVKDDKVKKGIQIIEQAALDAAKTVKRLQDFARIRVEHPFEPLDVNEVVEGVLKMVESRRVELEQTKGIAIKVEQALAKVGKVSGDAAELREALLNILFNALDAMPTGGKLTVKTLQDEEWVQITIKDTGVGIPDKVKAKVFEPFFTTKSSKGSGLGLSVTYGIIARHGGMIKFDSEVGKGTAFYIRLPLSVEEVRKQARKSKVVSAKPASILTVDDEPEVLKALGLMLEYFGHWVKDFTSGAEAIKAFKDGKYDVVITDLGMPEVSGWDVARAIKKMKPEVPVLLISGWVIDLDEEQKKLVDGVISKPFSRESIAAAVSKVFPARKKSTANKKQAVKKSAVKKSGGKKKK